jgi:hypothetical protein
MSEKEKNPAQDIFHKSFTNGDVNNLVGIETEKMPGNKVENQPENMLKNQPTVEYGKFVEEKIGNSRANEDNANFNHAKASPLNMEQPKIVPKLPSDKDGKNMANDSFKELNEKLDEILIKQSKFLDIISGGTAQKWSKFWTPNWANLAKPWWTSCVNIWAKSTAILLAMLQHISQQSEL